MASASGMRPTRVEIFSDGVFAIAITLLVLEIDVPSADEPDLGRALLDEWPSYLAYAISFLTVGVAWVHHHSQFNQIEHQTRPVLFLNLLVLLAVAFVPFPTAVMAESIGENRDEELAVAFYCVSLFVIGLAICGVWVYAARAGLLRVRVDSAAMRHIVVRNMTGPIAYASAAGLAFLEHHVALGLCAVAGSYYLFPGRIEE